MYGYKIQTQEETLNVWLKMMRMHIDYKICPFLLLNITITKVRKTEIMGKLASMVYLMLGEYCKTIFVLQGVKKKCKTPNFLEPIIAKVIV